MTKLDKETLDSLVKFADPCSDSCGKFSCADCRAAQRFCAQQLEPAQCKAAVPTQIKLSLLLFSLGTLYLAAACYSYDHWAYPLIGLTFSLAGLSLGVSALWNLHIAQIDPEE